mmetsp:Transcript_968/g.1296  ORF Transcript_968/g.1296 Transcript_968/m.1296 type:complete len:503 (-) Transcript_968:140-1648(-)
MSVTGSLATKVNTLSQRVSRGGILAQALGQTLGKTTYQEVPLTQPYPNSPDLLHPESEKPTYDPIKTTVSQLSNGIRVVSRNTQDPISNLGLYVNAGSRYCSPETSGIGHFLESLATEGTPNINPDRFAENLARTGSTLSVQAFRDSMIYQMETFPSNAAFALESIAEIIWNPHLQYHRIAKLKKEYLFRRGDLMKDAEVEMPEYMHQAAYQGNTIGLPLFCDHNTINNITQETIEEYINVFYQPNRMIICGVGIEHDKLERLASETFGDIKANPNYANIETQQSMYTGGQLKQKYDFENNSDTHISLIFETENWLSPDLMPLCVLNMMMGGGGSFSAGGPGKGMYTRLYRDVLGSHSWINHISCSHSIFDDTGIFCFYGFSDAQSSADLTSVMVREAINMLTNKANDKELERAKKSLASNICFEFENRQIVFEDLARQIQVFGSHKTPQMWRDEIMNVDADAITRVVTKLLKSKPTILAMGPDVSRVPSSDEIQDVIKENI